MYKWLKYGLIIKPDKNLWWMQTHAMVPTVEHLEGALYKIYYSGRDKNNCSQIGYSIIDFENPTVVIEQSREPVLSPGALGCFDDSGVTPTCIINYNDEKLLYYVGWNPGSTTRMNIFGGLAISTDGGGTFERYSKAPILERHINTAPFVLKDDCDFKMYYVAGIEWIHKDLPKYNIQLATSSDGKNWKRDGHICIDFKDNENALARPYVIKEHGIYKMWFASKGEAYTLRYAESFDGIQWIRKDNEIGISVSANGPDSEMMEYAAIINYRGKKHMVYNGNDYGKEGICLAIEEEK